MTNGNTLICEGVEGRIFEVDSNGSIHWEYFNPVGLGGPVTQGGIPLNEDVFRAYRYTPDYPAFDGKNLIPGTKLELNPWPDSCEIFTEPTAIQELDLSVHTAFPNPFTEYITFESSEQISIFNVMGKCVYRSQNQNQKQTINTQDWPAGFYILIADERHQSKIQKLIKQ